MRSLDPLTTDLALGRWSCCSRAPGTIVSPDQLDAIESPWLAASAPGTVAGALATAGQWDLRRPPNIDGQDWWFRTTFAAPEEFLGGPCLMCFDGLATLAEVWLNGEQLLVTDNMFRTYRRDVTRQLRTNNELVIGFRSLVEDVQKKRPRPRWKTNLVSHQQLRWHRATLLGRIPGWSPPVPVIGPWREIRLERTVASLTDVRLHTGLDGATGVVTFAAGLRSTRPIVRATLRVGEYESSIDIHRDQIGVTLTGELHVPNAPLWWPHTHGDQPLFPCRVIVETDSHRVEIASGERSLRREVAATAPETGSDRLEIPCGLVGFRALRIESHNGFSVELNGEPIYCRGACWTVSDIFNPHGTEESLRRDLTLARDAGANMLRVVGTMIYESDTFYRLCDELGILVWQDFMFANMDYPVEDESFAENVAAEATDQLRRLSPHPSVVVYCGNSEVEQQAAMLGVPRELWRNDWFGVRLARLCAEHHPGTAYVPSTPSGGILPFHPDSGVSHFYGVGAYLRSPAELRQHNVKFTSECLGFANIPEPATIDVIMEGATPVIHHPNWKQRVPRDTGAGWDFEDVRDHYLKHVYGLDPVSLRSSDMTKYLELSRVVTGELMAQTFSEWRGGHSQNGGGLVWFFKDLWPAAGWGIVDSCGLPKAAYYALKRTWGSRQITLTDEGLNGLHLHAINERAESMSGFVEVTLLKEPNVVVARNQIPVELAGRGRQLLNADEILGGFYDVNYAYRFGPPQHDVVVATLFDGNREIVSEAFHFVRRRESIVATAAIEAVAELTGETECKITLRSDRFLHNVRVSAKGLLPDDNYFHLPPQRTKVIRGSTTGNASKFFRVEVEALNLESSVTISVSKHRE